MTDLTSIADDRAQLVKPGQLVMTRWIPASLCQLGNHTRMDFAAIERAGRRNLQLGNGQSWPPILGFWSEDNRFVIQDGRHEFLALLALGRERILVAFVVADPFSKLIA